MTTLPWMPIFPGDELAETAHLSTEEYGAYCLLKLALWQLGSLQDDDSRLSRISRLSPERWREIRPILARLFIVAGEWRHEKQEEHRAQAKSLRERKSAAGKKGARSRWGEPAANASAISNRNGTAKERVIDSANAGANGLHPQMKNWAYEKEPHGAVQAIAIPIVTSKDEATDWLRGQNVFPYDFDRLTEKMLARTLDWSDLAASSA